MAAGSALRQFDFFHLTVTFCLQQQPKLIKQAVYDLEDPTQSPAAFQKTPEISAICYGQSSIVVGDLDGNAHLIAAPDFSVTLSWLAFVDGRITHAAFATANRGILVTTGEEADSNFPILKIWSLANVSRRPGSRFKPRLIASGKLQADEAPHPVSALALSSTLSHVAVGLADGTILLFRHLDGTITSNANSNTPATLPKPRLLQQSSHDPITNLAFAKLPANANSVKNGAILYATTTSRVLAYAASGKVAPTVIDDIGAAVGCSLVEPINEKFVLARDEAIYVYGSEGREACIAYQGPKSAIHAYEGFLVIVSPPFSPSATSGSATVRNFVSKNKDATGDIARVSFFEMANKYVAHSSAFPQGVRDIFVQWGKIWVLGHDGKVTKMEEISLAAKLDILFSKSLYLLALDLAANSKMDKREMAALHRRYADHLYSTNCFDEAMDQFLKTIGYTEASYVIRKFLDAQRIHNLTLYLEALHTSDKANSAHTSLLLNCYTKLKDTDRLDTFIKASATAEDSTQPPFDLDTAIRVTRQAEHFDHAAYLARRYGDHQEYLRIQIEDRERFTEAVQYIRGMGAASAESELVRYGKVLLQKSPSDTTQLMVDLCCGTLDAQPLPQSPLSPVTQTGEGRSYLSYLPLTGAPKKTAPVLQATPLPTPLPPLSTPSDSVFDGRNGSAGRSSTRKDLPRPDLFFPHFADQPREFVRYLETILDARYEVPIPTSELGQASAINNVLLELYLDEANGRNTDKAVRLLNNGNARPYDQNQALLVCATARFREGILLLYEKMGMINDIFDYQRELGDATQTLACLWKFGDVEPGLFRKALSWLSSDAALLSENYNVAQEILKHIRKNNLIKPVEVVKLLGRNNVATIGLVKQYLADCLGSDKDEIRSDKALIQSYRKEVLEKTREIETMTDTSEPQVFQVTRCAACGGQLDLPSVHFMCKHSYHQRCLPETATPDCPNCAHNHGLVKEIQRANERAAGSHDLFLSEVRDSDEPFTVIAAAFSRGFEMA